MASVLSSDFLHVRSLDWDSSIFGQLDHDCNRWVRCSNSRYTYLQEKINNNKLVTCDREQALNSLFLNFSAQKVIRGCLQQMFIMPNCKTEENF